MGNRQLSRQRDMLLAEACHLPVVCGGGRSSTQLQFHVADGLLKTKLATLFIQEMAKRGRDGYPAFYLNAAQNDDDIPSICPLAESPSRGRHLRRSKTLEKLRAGQAVRMCSLGHFIPAYIRHAAEYGFDCIWLDLEHRAMSDREVQALLAYFHLCDIDCLLRAPTLEKTRLYRYLEDGATGLMIPHVSTVEKARSLVDAVKFPPLGDRGLDGAGLDSDFIWQGGESYIDAANRETFLIVQIETPQAVEQVEAIAAVNGIDGLFIGPGDLGLRIQRTETDLTLAHAVETVAAAAQRHGKAWGMPAGSPEMLRQYHEQGARLIAYGGDFSALKEMLCTRSRELDELYRNPLP